MSSLYERDVVCPFYRKDVGDKICCEGLDEDSRIHLVFLSHKAKRLYFECFCCDIDRYKMCRVCRMLNGKYEDSDL